MIFKRKFFTTTTTTFNRSLLNYGGGVGGGIKIRDLLTCWIIIDSIWHLWWTTTAFTMADNELEGTPEGYYAFVESPKMEPPQVKLPPYIRLNKPCTIIGKRISNPPAAATNTLRRSLNNLCGDLNKGAIPLNPMNQNIYGAPYPFELIKNKTLEYFSKTLPILKSDETIPKVATLQAEPQYYLYQQPAANTYKPYGGGRIKRSDKSVADATTTSTSTTTTDKLVLEIYRVPAVATQHEEQQAAAANNTQRQSRKFCDNDRGVLCLLYKLVQGQVFRSLVAQKRQDPPSSSHLEFRTSPDASLTPMPMIDGPPTPCPAKVEYATPVFARNYQGIWRYVVQIPYEGYFTQTIEVTKCINSKCHYMDGGCLSSPRWVSLLVAEIYYPETITSTNRRPPVHRSPIMSDDPLPQPINDFHNYQQYLHKRAVPPNASGAGEFKSAPPLSAAAQTKKIHCDGMDELGCFQVRLYYDWFLVPGSCKCWRPDYFSKYMRWSRERDINLEL